MVKVFSSNLSRFWGMSFMASPAVFNPSAPLPIIFMLPLCPASNLKLPSVAYPEPVCWFMVTVSFPAAWVISIRAEALKEADLGTVACTV